MQKKFRGPGRSEAGKREPHIARMRQRCEYEHRGHNDLGPEGKAGFQNRRGKGQGKVYRGEREKKQ